MPVILVLVSCRRACTLSWCNPSAKLIKTIKAASLKWIVSCITWGAKELNLLSKTFGFERDSDGQREGGISICLHSDMFNL